MTNEAFARVKIDQLLKDAGWHLTDGRSVRYEYPLDDGGRADYVLFDRQGRALGVLEAKSTGVSVTAGEAQGQCYADLLQTAFAEQVARFEATARALDAAAAKAEAMGAALSAEVFA